MLKVGLRTVDSHEIEEVDALLDCGATGLFIDHTWLCQKKMKYYQGGYSHIIIPRAQRMCCV